MIALVLVVVFASGWIIGFVSCQSIDWYYRRKAAQRHAEWVQLHRVESDLANWNRHARGEVAAVIVPAWWVLLGVAMWVALAGLALLVWTVAA